MPIDPLATDLITLEEAAALVPGRPHRHTVYRWYSYGCHGYRLETIKLNGRVLTSPAALRDFLLAIQRDKTPVLPPQASESQSTRRTAAGRDKAKAKARKRLAKAGI